MLVVGIEPGHARSTPTALRTGDGTLLKENQRFAAPIGVNRRVDQQLGEEIALRVAAADLGDAMADGKQQIDDASALPTGRREHRFRQGDADRREDVRLVPRPRRACRRSEDSSDSAAR